MPAVAELIQDGYGVSQGLDRNTATLNYYVSGLTDSHDHQETFAALPVKVGDPFPSSFGRLDGAICNDIRISRISRDKAVAVVYFSNIKWGFPTRVIAQYDIDLQTVNAPHYPKLLSLESSGTNVVGWFEHLGGITRRRGVVRRFGYRTISGSLQESMVNFIASQVGKLYSFGTSTPYLFAGATATTSSNGATIIRYAYVTTTSLPEYQPPGAMKIPALGPLDEYVRPEEKVIAANMEITVIRAIDNYEPGEPLP